MEKMLKYQDKIHELRTSQESLLDQLETMESQEESLQERLEETERRLKGKIVTLEVGIALRRGRGVGGGGGGEGGGGGVVADTLLEQRDQSGKMTISVKTRTFSSKNSNSDQNYETDYYCSISVFMIHLERGWNKGESS